MTSATLTGWLKKVGDRVTAGEPIAEVETDKTTVELEAPATGVLEDIRVAAGTEDVEVGSVLALVREGDGGAESDVTQAAAPPTASVPANEAARSMPPEPRRRLAPPADTAMIEPPVSDVPATPLARRMAAVAGIDLTSIVGTAEGGRIGKADVERALGSSPAGAARAPVASSPPTARSAVTSARSVVASDSAHTDQPLTAMRRVTAERMTRAKQSAPHFYLEVNCSVDRLLALRDLANAAMSGDDLTVTDVIVRAAAVALTQVPLANSAWTGDAIRVYESADIAVAVTTPSGLLTPVVRAADAKNVRAIAAELHDLTARAREGRLRPSDYSGGTFTISNLGMFGVSSLYAILNPPQSCILGVGSIEQRPVARDRTVAIAAMMTVTLSADHRAIDGATGAELLGALRAIIEEPQPIFG